MSWEAVAVSTALLSLVISLGPYLGTGPVVLASALWIAIACSKLLSETILHLRRLQWVTGIYVLGVGLATLRMSSLGLVRLLGDRPALFWNVDWRFHTTQALGIARFGGASDSLDYAGQPLAYHAGPSWIAGALNDYLGIPIPFTLFLAVPILLVPMIAYWLFRMLRLFGFGRDGALLGVAVALNVPSRPLGFLRQLINDVPGAFLNPDAFLLTSGLMLNSLLALAPVLMGLYLVLSDSRASGMRIVGAIALGCVAALKPQYFVGAIGFLFVAVVLEMCSSRVPLRTFRPTILLTLVSSFIGVVLVAVGSGTAMFDRLSLHLPVPGGWASPSRTVWFWVLLLAVGVIASKRIGLPRTHSRRILSLVFASSILTLILDATTFRISESAIERAASAGLMLGSASQDGNLSQALVPLFTLMSVVAFALFASWLVAWRSNWSFIVAILAMSSAIPVTVHPLVRPTGAAAYEWSEEADLHYLLEDVEVRDGLWLSSDLADAAQNHARPLRAVSLTSLQQAQFYISNVAYVGWTRSDVADRMANVEAFYGSPWTPWHSEFLSANGIRFVLFNDRCPPRWSPDEIPVARVRESGRWTVLELSVGQGPVSVSGDGGGVSPNRPRAAHPIRALYGVGPCLGVHPQ